MRGLAIYSLISFIAAPVRIFIPYFNLNGGWDTPWAFSLYSSPIAFLLFFPTLFLSIQVLRNHVARGWAKAVIVIYCLYCTALLVPLIFSSRIDLIDPFWAMGSFIYWLSIIIPFPYLILAIMHLRALRYR